MNLSKENMRRKLHTFNLKKTLALALAGAFIAAGAAQLPQGTAFAAAQQVRQYHHNYDNEAALQNIQDCFGVEKKVLAEYQAKGWRTAELHHAAFIAHMAKAPIADVLNAKAQNKTWSEIMESYGITRDQYWEARRDFRSSQLAKSLDMKEADVKALLSSGYHPRDIAMAASLAQKANKSVNDVLAYKKINNTWRDVAASLGLTDEAYESCRGMAQDCFGNGRHMRWDGDRQNFRRHHQW